ncbi:MAG: glycosyltransferase [Paludibacteraceae bacterium]|nr:glycosyltransferase [Paludibacteraceae bacterium]
MERVSIILPVYNVEPFLKRCLDSVYNQGVSEDLFEVIAVDDGSPDNSYEILKMYESHENFTIIRQDNKGLSGARNKGLSVAKYNYVWFVDSDDTITENSIEKLVHIVTENQNLDCVCIGHKQIKENTETIFRFKGKDGLRCSGIEANAYLMWGCAPFYVFSKSFLLENGIVFHEGVYHEDLEFYAKVTAVANNVYFSDFVYYNYIIRESGSITSTFKIKRSDDILLISEELIKFRNSIKDETVINYLNRKILFNYVLSIKDLKPYYSKNKKEIDSYIEKNLSVFQSQDVKAFYKSINWCKLKIWGIMMYINPYLLIRL